MKKIFLLPILFASSPLAAAKKKFTEFKVMAEPPSQFGDLDKNLTESVGEDRSDKITYKNGVLTVFHDKKLLGYPYIYSIIDSFVSLEASSWKTIIKSLLKEVDKKLKDLRLTVRLKRLESDQPLGLSSSQNKLAQHPIVTFYKKGYEPIPEIESRPPNGVLSTPNSPSDSVLGAPPRQEREQGNGLSYLKAATFFWVAVAGIGAIYLSSRILKKEKNKDTKKKYLKTRAMNEYLTKYEF